jgi:hypothetical protein
LLSGFGYEVTEDQLAGLISAVDVDGTGDLNFDEFTTVVILLLAANAEEGEAEAGSEEVPVEEAAEVVAAEVEAAEVVVVAE